MDSVAILSSDRNIIIVDDFKLSVDALNKCIHEKLVLRGDIRDQDTRTSRAVRKDKYIVIHAHGSFGGSDIVSFLKEELLKDSISCEMRYTTQEELSYLEDVLPTYKILNNQYRGAPESIKDSDTLDKGVEDLCYSLNRVPGIHTFASCDGHNGARPLYVCYTTKNMHALECVSYYLTFCIEKFVQKLNIITDKISIKNEVSYMPDGSPTGVYFTFKIIYLSEISDQVYALSRMIAFEIENQLRLNNTGILGIDGFYHFKNI